MMSCPSIAASLVADYDAPSCDTTCVVIDTPSAASSSSKSTSLSKKQISQLKKLSAGGKGGRIGNDVGWNLDAPTFSSRRNITQIEGDLALDPNASSPVVSSPYKRQRLFETEKTNHGKCKDNNLPGPLVVCRGI